MSLSTYICMLDITASLYRNGKVTVQESALSLPIMQRLRLRLQSLYANDGSRRTISSATWQVPGNLLYVWGNYETGAQGDTLNYWTRKSYTLGGSIYMGNIIPRTGSLSFSYEKSLDNDRTRTLRTDYNQSLYSGRWGSLNMNAGFNSTSSQGGDKNNEKFINLTFYLPLRANFNVGYSRDDYGSNLDFGADMSLDGTITSLGGTVTRNQPNKGDTRTTYNGYVSYDGRYGTGSMSTQGSSDSKSYSLLNQSTLGWNTQGVALGKGGSNSAIMIQLPSDMPKDQMEARVGNASYPLSGGRNLITVSPFNTYPISIYDSGETDESYNIDSEVNEYTLYPGNVVKLTPEVQKMVTVFGRLTTPEGEAIKHAKVSNHIGYTNSDEEGNFSIDVSRTTPQLIVEADDSSVFDINFNLKPRHKGAIWVGDLILKERTLNYDLPDTDGNSTIPRF
ncbi:MAG: CS1-pili formation C-terminal domain-containing protein [Enterobacteriaceae bacterium]